jgi:hypothetical protein
LPLDGRFASIVVPNPNRVGDIRREDLSVSNRAAAGAFRTKINRGAVHSRLLRQGSQESVHLTQHIRLVRLKHVMIRMRQSNHSRRGNALLEGCRLCPGGNFITGLVGRAYGGVIAA